MASLLPAPHPHPANKHPHTGAELHGVLLHVRQSMVGNSSVRYSTVRYVADRCHFTLHASSPSEHKIGIFVLEQRDKWHREA